MDCHLRDLPDFHSSEAQLMTNEWQIPKMRVHKILLIKSKVLNQIWWSWCYYNEKKYALSSKVKRITVDQSKVKKIDCSVVFLATRYIWGIFNIDLCWWQHGFIYKSDLRLNRSSVNLWLLRGHLQWEQIWSQKIFIENIYFLLNYKPAPYSYMNDSILSHLDLEDISAEWVLETNNKQCVLFVSIGFPSWFFVCCLFSPNIYISNSIITEKCNLKYKRNVLTNLIWSSILLTLCTISTKVQSTLAIWKDMKVIHIRMVWHVAGFGRHWLCSHGLESRSERRFRT